jgi:glycosyltransferase involved in cell wall biosynthesis
VSSIHHGFDGEVFFGDKSPLPRLITEKLDSADACLKLLFVSHYNYYRNFETLFHAIALARKRAPNRRLRLFLTCTLDDSYTPGAYKTSDAARLIRDLGIRQDVVELGSVPYHQLHHVYRACDVYVSPAYAETFAHPLVEAMACGLPVIASDIPAHREVCSTAAFFDRFSAEELANHILEVSPPVKRSPVAPERIGFSWSEHVAKLLAIASQLRNGTAENEDLPANHVPSLTQAS